MKSFASYLLVWIFVGACAPIQAGVSGTELKKFVQEESVIWKAVFGLGPKGYLGCKSIVDTRRVANYLIEDLKLLDSLSKENPVYKMMIDYLFINPQYDDSTCTINVDKHNISMRQLALKNIIAQTDLDSAVKDGAGLRVDLTELCHKHAPDRIVQSVQLSVEPVIKNGFLYGFIIKKHTQALNTPGQLFKMLFLMELSIPRVTLEFNPSCGPVFFGIVATLLHDLDSLAHAKNVSSYSLGGDTLFDFFWVDRSEQPIVLKGGIENEELLYPDATEVRKYLGELYNKTYTIDLTKQAQQYDSSIEKYVFFIKLKPVINYSELELSIQGYSKHKKLEVQPLAESVEPKLQPLYDVAVIPEEQAPVRRIIHPVNIEQNVLDNLFQTTEAHDVVLQVADTKELEKALMLFYMTGQHSNQEQNCWYCKVSMLVMQDVEQAKDSIVSVVLVLDHEQDINNQDMYFKTLLAACMPKNNGQYGSFCSDMTICVAHTYENCQRYWITITPLVTAKSVYGFTITKYCCMKPKTSL